MVQRICRRPRHPDREAPRPKILGETHGLIRVLVDAAFDLVLGATELRTGIWTHPSSTEALNEVLARLVPIDED